MKVWSRLARRSPRARLCPRPGTPAPLSVECLEDRCLLTVPPVLPPYLGLTNGTTGTGLDRLVKIIAEDTGLRRCVAPTAIATAAANADRMDQVIVDTIRATGLANDGAITAADVRDFSRYIQSHYAAEWTTLHGDDENGVETGFHLVQGNGAATYLFSKNAVDTVADGIYHLGFGVCYDQLLNEDGNANASVSSVAAWLSQLLQNDLAAGTLKNPDVNPYVTPSTGTGLDRLVTIITTDPGLARTIPTTQIMDGARAADAMNRLIVDTIRATGLANDGAINAADVRDFSSYIQSHYGAEWVVLHGDDEGDEETGFHKVQNNGGTTQLFNQNAINTVADGIYHLGFGIRWDRLINEDGNDNASVSSVAAWLGQFLQSDLATGTLQNPAVNPYVLPSTGTGLDQLVTIITTDPGLARRIATSQIMDGARAADAMNRLIVDTIRATGLANDGAITAADVRDFSSYIQAHYAEQWVLLHGDDEDCVETGFHKVQGDGATTYLFGKNAVDTVADGIYHLGFGVCYDQLLNEDGNANASVFSVASWLSQLLQNDLAAGTLVNPNVNPYVTPSTGTGLDRLVTIITTDPGLAYRLATSQIMDGARAADAMNRLIVDTIRATGLANDGAISAADVRDFSSYIQAHYAEQWVLLHGDDECDEETGFHKVQNDGGSTRLFGDQNAIDTVADGIYHLGFGIRCDRLINEDGNDNASVASVAWWLSWLLKDDLARGTLVNPGVNPYVTPSTGTGLDQLVTLIMADPGLNARIATSQIMDGARAADAMNRLIVDTIRATGLANDGTISAADVRDFSSYVQSHYGSQWVVLHGDDEGDEETGFHKVQNDGATTILYDNSAVDTVADGVYHLGFGIRGSRLINEDGNDNASVFSVAYWLGDLLEKDLAAGTLKNPAVNPYVSPSTGTGLDRLVTIITTDPGLNDRLATTEIMGGARAADAMNRLIVEAVNATGVGADRVITATEVRTLNAYVTARYAAQWVVLHGDDEDCVETGFHLVQGDGASTRLFDRNAVDTVADGLYHLGFGIRNGRLLNEDGAENASLTSVAGWLTSLLYVPPAAEPPPVYVPTTGTGLDTLVTLITSDAGLRRNVTPTNLATAARAADAMNAFILEAIKATGVANDGTLNAADVRDVSNYIAAHHAAEWTLLHGDDESGVESGFHYVQGDGAVSRLFGDRNAVDTVADGVYHLGFGIRGDRLINEDGNDNASVRSVAFWLSELLEKDLAAGTLKNTAVPPVAGTTGTGLDHLVSIVTADPGLNARIATSQIQAGARAADEMNRILIEAIRKTGVAADGHISADDVRTINAWIRANFAARWAELHGDDEGGVETGFHLVQDDGGTTRLFDRSAVNTVADGIYHLGFPIQGSQLTNEDGNANASVNVVAFWLNELLATDLAAGTLV